MTMPNVLKAEAQMIARRKVEFVGGSSSEKGRKDNIKG